MPYFYATSIQFFVKILLKNEPGSVKEVCRSAWVEIKTFARGFFHGRF